jgi:hypothetical protein
VAIVVQLKDVYLVNHISTSPVKCPGGDSETARREELLMSKILMARRWCSPEPVLTISQKITYLMKLSARLQ